MFVFNQNMNNIGAAKPLKKMLKNRLFALLLILGSFGAIFLDSCKKESDGIQSIQGGVTTETPSASNLSEYFGSIELNQVEGIVQAEGLPLVGATVRCGFGSESTQTDPNGYFLLTSCESYDRYGFVTVEAPGHFAGYRQYFPSEGGRVIVRVSLLPHTYAVSFEANSVSTIETDWGSIAFAPGAFATNGLLYSGTVHANIEHIAPSQGDLFDVIPGGLAGMDDDGMKVLETFGMVGVELFTDDGQPLDVLLPATATMNIDPNQLAYAEESIDLWSLNPESGLWEKEGQAQRVDNAYQMELPHFSWWNIDVPSSFVWLEGTVTRNSEPIGQASVTISTPNAGCASTYTNSFGAFSGMVPKEQLLDVEVKVCLENDNALVVGVEAVGPLTDSSSVFIEADAYQEHFVTGQFVGCEGESIQYGYMMVDGEFQAFEANGSFGFYSCAEQFEIVAYEVIPTQGVLASDTLVIDFTNPMQSESLGEIMVCNEVIVVDDSTATDGDYEYETVVIGTHEWFAENLQTTTYANGDPIIAYANFETWSNLAEGQYLHYDFLQGNLDDHGRLYNGYAVQDPRGLCPSGWHVSTAAEWAELVQVAGLFNMPEGTVLKSSTLDDPAWNGYNQLGFSATPGGRMSSEGDMNLLGSYAYYWVDSTSTQAGTGYRIMSTSMGSVGAGDFSATMGYSVRCVRD